MRIDLHPEAHAELREAALWYEQRRPRLGDEFLAAVSTMMERICEAPGSFPLWPGLPVMRAPRPSIRRCVLQRFPYALAFEAHPDHVRLLAIAHTNRRPLYWIGRAS